MDDIVQANRAELGASKHSPTPPIFGGVVTRKADIVAAGFIPAVYAGAESSVQE